MNLLPRTARTLFIGLSFTGVCACNGATTHSATIRPTYDKATGHLKELAFDANDNGRVDDIIVGECGADTAYYQAYWMADMFIYPGPDRVPPSGK